MTPEEVAIIAQEMEPTHTLVLAPTSTPTPTLTPTSQVNPISEPAPPITGSGQPSWLLPVVLLSAAIVVIAIGIRAWSAGK